MLAVKHHRRVGGSYFSSHLMVWKWPMLRAHLQCGMRSSLKRILILFGRVETLQVR